MNELDRLRAEVADEYERGYAEGLAAYAWWKDGVQYVGTTGKTLVNAVRDFLAEREGVSS